jgi:hypothetical protein
MLFKDVTAVYSENHAKPLIQNARNIHLETLEVEAE